jgi:phosphate transport system protein
MGTAAGELLELSLRTIAGHDRALCQQVIDGDDVVDAYYLSIEQWVMDLFALQNPVASDLRLLTAMLHVDLHLERIADMAVNIAKIVNVSWGLPRNAAVVERLEEMGGLSLQILAAAMDAFARRDLALCRRLTTMDDTIDRLNRGMLAQVLEATGGPADQQGTHGTDRAMLEWGIAMHVVSREIERVGDHAVDIGEQAAFLITGEFVEFTDASHPELEHPELEHPEVALPAGVTRLAPSRLPRESLR